MITFVKYLKMMKNKKTLVLGATTKPDRYAFRAINMLVEKGHTVLAIGQNTGEVAGVKIYTKAMHFSYRINPNGNSLSRNCHGKGII